MKPVVTWIVLANSRMARVLVNRGPGKGVEVVPGREWTAPPVATPRDRAGMGHSIAGPGVAAVSESDARHSHDQTFAREIVHDLQKARRARQFDRLVLSAGPHMLGLLRPQLDAPLRAMLVGEIAKDLTAQSIESVEAHVGDLIAV